MRRLIINADDFGLTPGVNRAIAECFDSGLVTSTTLMAGSAAFDEAVSLSKSRPTLCVGCHAMLVDGRPLTASPASLLAPGTSRFRAGIAGFAIHALRGRILPDEVAAEALAQFRRLQQAGITITHFDTHKHTHMFPAVLRPLLRAAKEAGIPAVRNPFVPIKAVAFSHLFRRPRLWVRYSEVRFLRTFAAEFDREVRAAGLKTTKGTFGIIATGALDERIFAAILGSIPEGVWEFVCHPGYADAELEKTGTRLRSSREAELRLLTSPACKRLLEQQAIERISFAGL
ncbi:MAG: ChbG/HpnK family deacetylase [Acidobacteriales bacterium]|nr:ChbG/HpnK family deacetylase [Terriglobales bacterium]